MYFMCCSKTGRRLFTLCYRPTISLSSQAAPALPLVRSVWPSLCVTGEANVPQADMLTDTEKNLEKHNYLRHVYQTAYLNNDLWLLVQGACVLGINSPPVTIKNIENAIIDYAWAHGLMQPEQPKHRTGKTVAVVGSGPSGLAAAAQLNKVRSTLEQAGCSDTSLVILTD